MHITSVPMTRTHQLQLLCFSGTCTVKTVRPPVRKGKGLSKTGHEGPERECMYSCTLSLISALDGRWWLMPHPGRFTPWKETQFAFHRWSPESVWTRAENLAATGIRSSDCPARSKSLYITLGCQNRGPPPCMCVCVLTHTHRQLKVRTR
jgi:hypothetical protein